MKKRLSIILLFFIMAVLLIYFSNNYTIYSFISKDRGGIYNIYKNSNNYVVKAEGEYFYVGKKGFANKIDRPIFDNETVLIYDKYNFEGLSMAEFNESKETLIKNGKIYFWIQPSNKNIGFTLEFDDK